MTAPTATLADLDHFVAITHGPLTAYQFPGDLEVLRYDEGNGTHTLTITGRGPNSGRRANMNEDAAIEILSTLAAGQPLTDDMRARFAAGQPLARGAA